MSTPSTNSGLDADELLHLAMKAMDAGNHEATIGYLKRGLAIAPDDGGLHYLLGAIHAELGMHDRAIAELTRATELAPHLETAHFQLGLLHAARGDISRAMTAWQPIESLPSDHPLYLFRAGVLHLADENYEACISAIRDGIARNQEFAALNDDMGRLITQAEAALAAGRGRREPARQKPVTIEHAPSVNEAQHVLLSRYQSGPEGGR